MLLVAAPHARQISQSMIYECRRIGEIHTCIFIQSSSSVSFSDWSPARFHLVMFRNRILTFSCMIKHMIISLHLFIYL